MKTYELIYLISPQTSEQEILSLQERIKSLIEKEQGSVKETSPPQKKLLAYLIKKQREAFLTSLVFLLEPENLKKIEKQLKEEGQILRYLIVVKKIIKKSSKSKTRRKKILKPKVKVELEEIEKKLEEILGK